MAEKKKKLWSLKGYKCNTIISIGIIGVIDEYALISFKRIPTDPNVSL